MSSVNDAVAVAGRLWSKSVAFFSLSFLLVSAQPGLAQEEPLKFFKNYFVAGDYVVGGASLWRKGKQGFATADIDISGVPPNVDILAAFLYVQTAEKRQWSGIAGAKFEGVELGLDPNLQGDSIAKALTSDWELAPQPCWTTAFPGGRKLVTYRADVLRFLPIDNREFLSRKVKNTNFRKHLVNGPHRVVVPDSGPHFGDDDENGQEREGVGPRAVGASLVVVYRDPRQLVQKAVVIYDGGHVKQALPMLQTIQGFYQASITNPQAKMTHIVGDGRPLRSERISLVGKPPLPGGTNPFVSSNGAKWDNITFYNLPALGGAASATVRIDSHGALHDCLQYSAIIFSTKVQDGDYDGLLDRWEEDLAEPLLDPNGEQLPDLHAMGADPRKKDLFVEIGYLFAGPMTYGGVPKPAHTHQPTHAALKMIGDMFKNAPVVNPDGSEGINVHFDVGDDYPPGDQNNPAQNAEEYIIRGPDLARGGEAIDETLTNCVRGMDDPPWVCQFSDVPGTEGDNPGTVGWKTGFRFLRDEPLNLPGAECEAAEHDGNPLTICERRFDLNRWDMFRYLFIAHSLGLPKEPCLNSDGSTDRACQQNNGDFHVPRTNSGIADFPGGGDLLVTLGAFDDNDGKPVGTDIMVANTVVHELGHTFGLTHAGAILLPPLPRPPAPAPPLPPREPNCKPNYLSVENYLFQLRFSEPALSSQRLPPLNENGLQEAAGLDSDGSGIVPTHRTSWFAPKEFSYLKNVGAVTKHCDGSELTPEEQADLTRPDGLGGMVRVEAVSPGGAIDWNADGDPRNTVGQDINFDGEKTALNAGSNDWDNILLNQVGGRRNVGGLFLDTRAGGRLTLGPMSLKVGSADIGSADIGSADIGSADIGSADIGSADIGRADTGSADIGSADIGRGLFGGGDLDFFAPNEPFHELDLPTAKAIEGDAPLGPPIDLTACLTSDGECTTDGGNRPVRLNWKAPHFGRVNGYLIFRFTYESEPFTAPADLPIEPIASLEGNDVTTYLDSSAPSGAHVAYFVKAQFGDDVSGISNFATVTTPVNSEPVIVGVANIGNCYPFMCNDSGLAEGQSIHYQQVYAASAFSGITEINSLTFFREFAVVFGGTSTVLSGNYHVSLSTTSRPVNGLSPNLASNIGADNTLIFSGNLGGVSTTPSFTITASEPFVYDPTGGNLLLNIVVTNQTVLINGTGNGFNDADISGTSTTRAYAVVGFANAADVLGLVTEFNRDDVIP